MSLGWPLALAMLLILPLVLGLYVWRQRRLRAAAVRHSNVALIRAALGTRRKPWTRHLPLVAVLLALMSLGLASARPATQLAVPQDRTTIMLAIDVSRSMCSIDVEPNRIAAAKSGRARVHRRPTHGHPDRVDRVRRLCRDDRGADDRQRPTAGGG
jgi:Ca-activated chloride channel family protein